MKTNSLSRLLTAQWKRFLVLFALLGFIFIVSVPTVVSAAADVGRIELAQADADNGANDGTKPRDCQNDFCSPFRGSSEEEKAASQPQSSNKGQTIIDKYLGPATAALSALAGIAVAGSVIFGGIQYATAGGDSGKVAAAKQRILKAILVLVAYVFFYAFLQWLLPEGI